MLDVVDIPTAAPVLAAYRADGRQEIARVTFDVGDMHLDETAFPRVDNGSAHIDTRLNTIHPRKIGTSDRLITGCSFGGPQMRIRMLRERCTPTWRTGRCCHFRC